MHRAFTLIETIVTVTIFATVMVVIANSILLFYRANASSIEQSFQIDSAQKGVQLMVREMREMTNADNGAYPVASMASTSITFFSDTDRDAAVEMITYALSASTTLSRTVVEPSGVPPAYLGAGSTTPVSVYVRNEEEGQPIFRYYDKNGVEITDYANVDAVRFVSVSLIVNVQPIRAPQEFTLRSSATLRNLRNE